MGIQFAFAAWLMWWRGRIGTKAAFKLRQGLIAHDLNLRRSTNENIEATRRRMHGIASYLDDDPSMHRDPLGWRAKRKQSREEAGLWNPADPQAVGADAPRSMLKRHQNRWLTCRHCSKKYAETHNHSRVCAYHPGLWKLSCP